MSTEEQQVQASTYFVADRDHLEEMRRVEIQDKLLTASMGGALPELPDPTSLQHVLDVGCETGCWLLVNQKLLTLSQLLQTQSLPLRNVEGFGQDD